MSFPAAAPGQGCALLTAQITSKPESVTSTNAPTFKFITSEAAIAGPGFECQLVSSPPANIPNVTHDWRACTSPIAYAGVPDGSYSFSVRIAGDEVSEPYSFAVDATPPTTTLEPVRPVISFSALSLSLSLFIYSLWYAAC